MQDSWIPTFEKRTRRSKKAFDRAVKVSPGGVQSAPRFHNPYPIYMKRGNGSRIYDVDGNEYIDYYLAAGPLILGHAHPSIISAVESQLRHGNLLAPVNEIEIEFSEKLIGLIPGAEMLRQSASGSEAIQTMLMLARAFTKRDKIVKFEGAYHGHFDHVLISDSPKIGDVGPLERPRSVPESAGILPCILQNTIILPFNDIEALEKLFEAEGNDIAAVIVEPYMRGIPPKRDFLDRLGKLTHKYGALLTFDEIVTGFRVSLGGAQEYYGIKADLVAMGKIIGGGFSIGITAGRKEIIGLMDPRHRDENYVYHAGTYCGNPIVAHAGLAAIRELEKRHTYEKLHNYAEMVMKGLRDAAEDTRHSIQVTDANTVWRVFFTEGPVTDYRTAMKADHKKYLDFCMNMIIRGIYLHPGVSFMVSTAHTKEDANRTIEAFHDTMKILRSNG